MSPSKTSRTAQTEQVEVEKFEDYPLSRAEYISSMVHLYRGEQQRAQVWRTRLDTTTNWAVVSTGAFLSFAFSSETVPQIVIILGMYLVFGMLVLESRRFRFYDVWRNRVRRVEENFYVPILRRDLSSPVENWGFYVAEDLLNPRYKISFLSAFKTRLIYNYWPLFLILLGAWVVKIVSHAAAEIPTGRGGNTDYTLSDLYTAVGYHTGLPPWLSIGAVIIFYGFLAWVIVAVKRGHSAEQVYFGAKGVESIDDVG